MWAGAWRNSGQKFAAGQLGPTMALRGRQLVKCCCSQVTAADNSDPSDHHLARCVQAPFDEQCEAHPGPRPTVSSPEEALQQHLSKSGGPNGSAHVAAAEVAVAEADGPQLVGFTGSDSTQAAVSEPQRSTADVAAPGQLQQLQQPWEAAGVEASMLSPFQQMSQLRIASSGRLPSWDHAAAVDAARMESAVYFDTQDSEWLCLSAASFAWPGVDLRAAFSSTAEAMVGCFSPDH